MITNKGKDYWDPPRTTIMEAMGDLDRGDKEELHMGPIGSFNFLNMHRFFMKLDRIIV